MRNGAKRKKLLVVLGAGSSVPLGMPLVSDLDKLMKRWAQEWATGRWGGQWDMPHGFPNHFDALWRAAEEYYLTSPAGPRPAVNFEMVLGDMVALAHWMEPSPWGDRLRQVTCNGATPQRMTFAYGESPYGAAIELMSQLSYLLRKLVSYMRALSRQMDLASDSAKRYVGLLGGLREEFDVGIYNLNYDAAALDAMPVACTGFGEDGTFEPNRVNERREWDFVYHLHGSVHHSLDRRGFGGEIVWRPGLDGEFFDGDGPEAQTGEKRSEGLSFPRTTLIAGGFKLDQMLVEPFRSLHAALVRHVYAADAILIGGYGFGDAHVNLALRSRLSGAEGRPPAMVLDLAGGGAEPMAFRGGDLWARGLCSALDADGHFFSEPRRGCPPVPSELAETGAFEVDAQRRVAIWHGGFVEAGGSLPRIIQWLDGATDDALCVR